MSYSQQDLASNSYSAPLAEIYDTTRFGELYHGSRQPPINNLGLAAKFMVQVFQLYGIPFAFFGGWAMYLRGSPRHTQDVDIAVGTTMAYLESILLQCARLSVPAIHGQTSIQIFIHTGGEWDEQYPEYTISADIIINGNLNTPPNIPNGTELITPRPRQQTPQGTSQVSVVNIFFQVKSKLDAYNTRRATGAQGNDYRDLVWLLGNHVNEIYQCRQWLDYNLRSVFCQDYAAQNTPENSDYAKTILGLDETTS